MFVQKRGENGVFPKTGMSGDKMRRLAIVGVVVFAAMVAGCCDLDGETVAVSKLVDATIETSSVAKRDVLIGDIRVTVGEKESGKTSAKAKIAIIDITTDAPKLRVKCITAAAIKLSESRYAIVEPGKHYVDILGLGIVDGALVFDDAGLSVEVPGKTSPPGPDVDPPPGPDPPPDVNVPNEYNVGKIAYDNAPDDPVISAQIAGWYRAGGKKLFGDPVLLDIASVLSEINVAFVNKQCTTREICEQWGRWKLAVNEALNAEQRRRNGFKREDWFAAFAEIAAALEARGK